MKSHKQAIPTVYIAVTIKPEISWELEKWRKSICRNGVQPYMNKPDREIQ